MRASLRESQVIYSQWLMVDLQGSNPRPHDCQETVRFTSLPFIPMSSIALHQLGASAFAQEQNPFSFNSIHFWHSFRTATRRPSENRPPRSGPPRLFLSLPFSPFYPQ